MPDQASRLDILIDIQTKIGDLVRAQQEFRNTRAAAMSFGSMLKTGLGIALAQAGLTSFAATLKAAVLNALEFATQIHDTSENLEMSAVAFEVLRRAVLQAGGDVAALTGALNNQQRAIVAARTGVGAAAAAFRMLGLDAAALEGQAPERQFEAIAKAAGHAADRQAALAAAASILGEREFKRLRATVNDLAENGYDKLATSVENAGMVMDNQRVKQLAAAKQQLSDFKEWITIQFGGLMYAVLHPLDNDLLQQAKPGGLEGSPTDPAATQRAIDLAKARETLANTQLDLSKLEISQSTTSADQMFNESSRRELLIGTVKEEIAVRQKLIELKKSEPLGDNDTPQSRALELAKLQAQQRASFSDLSVLSGRSAFAAIKDKYNQVENPAGNPNYLDAGEGVKAGLMSWATDLGSTGETIAKSMQDTLGQALDGISSDLWDVMKRTAAWKDMWQNIGNVVGKALTELIVKLLIIKPLLGLFGLGGTASVGSVTASAPSAAADAGAFTAMAGGGTFVTSGPTHLTVGDNPGGVELVNVIPLSGVGRSTVNGRTARLAGGGTLLAGGALRGAAPAPVVINQTLNIAMGVAATVRAEIAAMAPQLRAMSVDAVQEAAMRGRLRT